MRRESRRQHAENPNGHTAETPRIEEANGHTAETPNTRETTDFYARIPSGLRAFRDFPSGLRALRVYMVVGMCCVEGSSTRRGY